MPDFNLQEPARRELVDVPMMSDTETEGKGKQKEGEPSHNSVPSTDAWNTFLYNASQAFLPSDSLEKEERGWVLDEEYIRAEKSNWLKKGYGHAEGQAMKRMYFWDMPFLKYC